MVVRLSSAVLYGEDQPDFGRLVGKGWVHPSGMRSEPLERSLVKDFGNLKFQIVRHEFGHLHSYAEYQTYTEVYVHHALDDEDRPILKGHGSPFSLSELFAGMVWLQEEFE